MVKSMAIKDYIIVLSYPLEQSHPKYAYMFYCINKLCMSQTVLLFGTTHFLLWRRVSVSSTMWKPESRHDQELPASSLQTRWMRVVL